LLAAVRRADPGELRRLAQGVAGVRRGAGSIPGTLAVLRHVETADDLRRAERVAGVAGRPAAGLFRVGGRSALAAAGAVAANALLATAGAVLSLVLMLAAAVLPLLVRAAILPVRLFARAARRYSATSWGAGRSSNCSEARRA